MCVTTRVNHVLFILLITNNVNNNFCSKNGGRYKDQTLKIKISATDAERH